MSWEERILCHAPSRKDLLTAFILYPQLTMILFWEKKSREKKMENKVRKITKCMT